MNDLFSLVGQTAVITGAAGLLGRQHCLALASAGANVIVADLDGAACAAIAAELSTDSLGVVLDVTEPASIGAMMELVGERYGRIHILVNNAAINDMFENPEAATEQSKLENYPLELWQRLLNVNVTGVFLCAQAVGRQMAQQGGGSIINIASRAWLGIFGSASYSMTKGALVGVTRSLALELGPVGIRVNAIAPGYVQTPMSASLPPQVVRRSVNATPLRRAGNPDDVARLATELAHPQSFVTGQVIAVCGGRTIGQPGMAEGTAS